MRGTTLQAILFTPPAPGTVTVVLPVFILRAAGHAGSVARNLASVVGIMADEEPTPARQFGESYVHYRRRVARWIGRVHPEKRNRCATG
jgi:protein-S-isoprenylcysteine O-methyltransferase Ste14